MSKSISISFGKPKSPLPGANTHQTQKPRSAPTKPRLLGHDSDDEDEPKQPVHQVVTEFAANGAILGEQRPEKEQLVIKNAGNGDWRKRRRANKNPLPGGVTAQNGNATVVEKDEVSKASGLYFAKKDKSTQSIEVEASETTAGNGTNLHAPTKEQTLDEEALQALLPDGEGGSKPTAVIVQKENANLVQERPTDEYGDFLADLSARPDSATLDDYLAMPVEKFGLALIGGMGAKQKAEGKIANPGDASATLPKIPVPRSGYLGIGAKATPGAEDSGAWGKAAMRKGMKSKTGDGLYTPVILKDKRTGEMLTEDEFQARKKEAKAKLNGKEEDWRQRRDKNLDRSGTENSGDQKRLMDKDDDYRDRMHDFSRHSASHKDERNGSSRSDRSRSRDRRRRDDDSRDEKYRDRSRNGDRDRRRDKYRDDDRYDSSSSRKSSHRDGEKNGYDKNDDRRRRERY